MPYYELFARKFDTRDFELRHTLESAQPLTFHANYDGKAGTATYSTYSNIVNIAFDGTSKKGVLTAVSRSQSAIDEVYSRFRLMDNMRSIYKHIDTDDFMHEAIGKYYGMRVTLNDPWETMLCFIISQNNNVKRIRGITLKLIERFGQPIKDDSEKIVGRSFPSANTINRASVRELMECGVGFRAKYIKDAAEKCTNNIDLWRLKAKPYEEIKDTLMEIDGIGDKVADCIALMGYGKMEAFPIDTWSGRVLEKIYFKGRKQKIERLHDFVYDKWGKYAGYAQQYLYWHGRQSKI
ncbi:MAG: DNA-3-methyladenine glycosylase family protein [Candidatus Micrarchaeia archaeon]